LLQYVYFVASHHSALEGSEGKVPLIFKLKKTVGKITLTT